MWMRQSFSRRQMLRTAACGFGALALADLLHADHGEPTADAEVIAAVAVELLRRYDPPQPVRLLGVRVAGFEAPAARTPAESRQLRLQV